jgi:hypothetical protein
MTVEYFDQPPADWFVLDVMRRNSRAWDWDALQNMRLLATDVHDRSDLSFGPINSRKGSYP